MKKEEILNLLKKISYPGFSRDIVSFGMVSDIQIEESKLKINLKIKGDNEEKKDKVYLKLIHCLKMRLLLMK